MSLALGALATLNHLSGVRTTNINFNGQTVGIAILDGARFEKDANGFTVLTETNTDKESI